MKMELNIKRLTEIYNRNDELLVTFHQFLKDEQKNEEKFIQVSFSNFLISKPSNNMWRPPRKSWLTPKTTKAKVVRYKIIQTPQ